MVGADRGDHEPRQLASEQGLEGGLLVVGVLTEARHERRQPVPAGGVLDRARDRREERVDDVGHGDADHRRPTRAERRGQGVGHVVELAHGRLDQGAGVGQHVRVVVEDARHGLRAHPGALGDVAHRGHETPPGCGRVGLRLATLSAARRRPSARRRRGAATGCRTPAVCRVRDHPAGPPVRPPGTAASVPRVHPRRAGPTGVGSGRRTRSAPGGRGHLSVRRPRRRARAGGAARDPRAAPRGGRRRSRGCPSTATDRPWPPRRRWRRLCAPAR